MAKKKGPETVSVQELPNMLHLTEDELPEVRDWKVGKKYQILLDVEQTGLHSGGPLMDEKKGKFSADFKIIKASMPDEGSPEEEAKESPEVEAKEESSAKSGKIAQAIRRKFNKG
jgi:hypothetical protein